MTNLPAPYPPTDGSEPCRHNPNMWVPADEEGPSGQSAKIGCRSCSVREQCLAYGLSVDEVGIYGGMTTKERGQIRRRAGLKPTRVRETTVADVHRLRSLGFTITATAETLGIHPATVSKYRSMSPA